MFCILKYQCIFSTMTHDRETSENISCNPETTQFHTIKNSGSKANWTSDWEDIIMVDNALTGTFCEGITRKYILSISVWLTIIALHIIWNTYRMQETPRYILYLKQKNVSTKQNYTYDPTSQFRNLKECTEVGRRTSHWNCFHSRTQDQWRRHFYYEI